MSLLFVRRNNGDGMDVIKSVPIGCKSRRTKKLGYPKRCNHLWDYGEDAKLWDIP